MPKLSAQEVRVCIEKAKEVMQQAEDMGYSMTERLAPPLGQLLDQTATLEDHLNKGKDAYWDGRAANVADLTDRCRDFLKGK